MEKHTVIKTWVCVLCCVLSLPSNTSSDGDVHRCECWLSWKSTREVTGQSGFSYLWSCLCSSDGPVSEFVTIRGTFSIERGIYSSFAAALSMHAWTCTIVSGCLHWGWHVPLCGVRARVEGPSPDTMGALPARRHLQSLDLWRCPCHSSLSSSVHRFLRGWP